MDLIFLENFYLSQLVLLRDLFPFLFADGHCAQLIEELERKQAAVADRETKGKGKEEAEAAEATLESNHRDDTTQQWRKQSQRTRVTQRVMTRLIVKRASFYAPDTLPAFFDLRTNRHACQLISNRADTIPPLWRTILIGDPAEDRSLVSVQAYRIQLRELGSEQDGSHLCPQLAIGLITLDAARSTYVSHSASVSSLLPNGIMLGGRWIRNGQVHYNLDVNLCAGDVITVAVEYSETGNCTLHYWVSPWEQRTSAHAKERYICLPNVQRMASMCLALSFLTPATVLLSNRQVQSHAPLSPMQIRRAMDG